MMRAVHIIRSRRGSIAIEYALLLPALMLFVIGIMEVGRLLWTQTTLDRAAEAAARCGAVDNVTCADAAATADYAVTQAFGLNIAADAFTVSSAACGVSIEASFAYQFLVPWVTPQDLVLHASACYPLTE
jgi:Flp pilus assembly protein TadG